MFISKKKFDQMRLDHLHSNSLLIEMMHRKNNTLIESIASLEKKIFILEKKVELLTKAERVANEGSN